MVGGWFKIDEAIDPDTEFFRASNDPDNSNNKGSAPSIIWKTSTGTLAKW